MPVVVSEIVAAAEPEAVYRLAQQVESFPDFMPDVESVRILERDGSTTISHWVARIPEFHRTIAWTERDCWYDHDLRCEFEQTQGDFSLYRGIWEFRPQGQATLMKLQIEYEFNVPLIGSLIRGVIYRKMQQNCRSMLEALRSQAESSSPSGADAPSCSP